MIRRAAPPASQGESNNWRSARAMPSDRPMERGNMERDRDQGNRPARAEQEERDRPAMSRPAPIDREREDRNRKMERKEEVDDEGFTKVSSRR